LEPYLTLLLPLLRRVQRGDARIVVSVVTEAELLVRPLRYADQEALDRISDGAYGECVNCGQDIQVKRLEALPWARYCIKCQELQEQGLLVEEEV
jgi:RNA polymerase-binding transcription factor DksA